MWPGALIFPDPRLLVNLPSFAPAIGELQIEPRPSTSHEEKKPMEAFAERLRDAVAFGAYIDGEIIGLSVFKQEDGPKDAHKAHLSGVFVEPEQRGRGVAGMLLRAVIDYGREHVEQIMLTVAEGNEAAINLYQRSARCPAPLQSPRRSAGRQSK